MSVSMLEGNELTIRNLSSGRVLQAKGSGEDCEVGQSLSTTDDGAHQRWRLVPVARAKHQYQIQNVHTGTVLEVATESHHDGAPIFLWGDNGGAHQRWRLIPVGETEHEYAIINVNSGKAIDLWDGAEGEDGRIVQVGYWNGIQQRWHLAVLEAAAKSRAVLTIVRNEGVFLPIWLRYYSQFFPAEDIYVLDHQSTDGSTDGPGFVRVPVSQPAYGAGWQRDVVQRYQHELIDRYDIVLYSDVDEIVAPDPRHGHLGDYIEHFDQDFVTCRGYEVLHMKEDEPSFDHTKPVLAQRATWYANSSYSKSLLARVPMLWHGGFHERVDGRTISDSHLYLIHLHRMDYDICLSRHRERCRFPLAQIDRDHGWGYQNSLIDPVEFTSWFYGDSVGPIPIQPQQVPSYWRDVI